MSGNDHYADIRELADEARALDDRSFKALFDVLRTELARRETIRKGLDIGERLQFDTVVDLIRERTKLGEADALAMIRAHEPWPRTRGGS